CHMMRLSLQAPDLKNFQISATPLKVAGHGRHLRGIYPVRTALSVLPGMFMSLSALCYPPGALFPDRTFACRTKIFRYSSARPWKAKPYTRSETHSQNASLNVQIFVLCGLVDRRELPVSRVIKKKDFVGIHFGSWL